MDEEARGDTPIVGPDTAGDDHAPQAVPRPDEPDSPPDLDEPIDIGARSPETGLDEADEELYEEIRQFFVAFMKGVRAAQFYVQGNPLLHQFISDLQDRLRDLWDRLPALSLTISEDAIRWRGHPVYQPGSLQENLAFQLYRDGIRRLSLHPGLEGEELREFIDVLRLARHLKDEEDDLLTLMWRRDFQYVRYEYVDVLGDDLTLPTVDPNAQAGTELPDLPELELAPELATPTLREDFEPSLYFLEEAEISALQKELRTEWDRQLKHDVVTALLDLYELGDSDRRYEVTGILQELLPRVLAEADFGLAAFILQELIGVREEVGDPAVGEQVDQIAGELSQPVVLEQLVRVLEDGRVEPESEALATLLAALRPEAIVVLIQALPSISRQDARRQLEATLERLASVNPSLMRDLLESGDPAVAAQAAEIAGRLKATDLAEVIEGLLERPEESVRLAAVHALTALHSSLAGRPLQRALDDDSREVRVAAARGLASLRYSPAKSVLEKTIKSRDLWRRDLTEQLAFFEAYARGAGADGVRLLVRMLNGRRFLWIRYPTQVRACAARALGHVTGASAAKALADAEADADAMVRSAVQAARRGPTPEQEEGADESG